MLELSKVGDGRQGATRVSTKVCCRTKVFVVLHEFDALNENHCKSKTFHVPTTVV